MTYETDDLRMGEPLFQQMSEEKDLAMAEIMLHAVNNCMQVMLSTLEQKPDTFKGDEAMVDAYKHFEDGKEILVTFVNEQIEKAR